MTDEVTWIEAARTWLSDNAVLLGAIASALAIATAVFAGMKFFKNKPSSDTPVVSATIDTGAGPTVSEEFAKTVLEQGAERERELKAEIAELRARQEDVKDKQRDIDLLQGELSALQAKLADREGAVKEARAAANLIESELADARRGGNSDADVDLDAALNALEQGDFGAAQESLASLQENADDTAALLRQAKVAFSLGTIAKQEIDYRAAKSHFLRAHELDPDDLEIMLACEAIARLAGDLVLSARIADRLRDYVDNATAATNNDSEQVATICNAIGLSLNLCADFQAAQEFLERGLEIRERVLGEEHPDTASSYNNLASNLDDQGRYKKAEPLYRRDLEISQRLLGEAHQETATSYNNVAYNLNAQGRYDEAEPLYRRGLEIRQGVLGEEHPDTAASYNNVAYNLNSQGRYEDAEPLYRRGLAIFQRLLGEEHPDTATSYNNVAYNLNVLGRYSEAETLYRRGLEIRRRVLGEAHPDTATSYNNVAANLNVQGRYEEAEAHYRKAVGIVYRGLGPGHPNTKMMYGNLMLFLTQRGRAAEIEELRAEYPGVDD